MLLPANDTEMFLKVSHRTAREIITIAKTSRARMQTDGVDLGGFRGEVSFTVSQHRFAFIVTAAPIVVEVLHKKFRTPVPTRLYARHEVDGAPKDAL